MNSLPWADFFPHPLKDGGKSKIILPCIIFRITRNSKSEHWWIRFWESLFKKFNKSRRVRDSLLVLTENHSKAVIGCSKKSANPQHPPFQLNTAIFARLFYLTKLIITDIFTPCSIPGLLPLHIQANELLGMYYRTVHIDSMPFPNPH